ncbi:MAG: hypothetical protein IPK64_13920 [bacterium]|nr:hypothetical protein [bacterium]
MCPLEVRASLAAALLAALLPSVLAAPPAAGAAVPLDAGQGLLDRFRAAFDGGAGEGGPMDDAGCGTSQVREYLEQRPGLSPGTVSTIDDFLAYVSDENTLLSPGGHFRLGWFATGDNAVPSADDDPQDGVPDFVAHIARYLEESWDLAIGEFGFRAPPGGPIDVSFRRMHYYGYTVPVDPGAGTSRIVLHNSYSRFPPNDDPEGNAIGSAKVTAAHEFRHCSQYAGSRWSEGNWTELDATWAEERTFPLVNAYHHYLLGDSPVRRPQLPLDSGPGGTGSYDDAVFAIWLNARWGDAVIRDYWERRATMPDEDPLAAWDGVLAPRGASLAAAWAGFTGWNYVVGKRAVVGMGYADAADYPTGDVFARAESYPARITGTVAHLAATPVELGGFEDLGECLLRLTFDGHEDDGPLSLALHVRDVDGGASLESVGLDRENDAQVVLRTPAGRLASVGIVVGNPARAGEARAWTIDVDTIPGPPLPPRGRLVSIEPNPCNGGTWFDCAMTAGAAVEVDVYDARGRRFRRIFGGHLGPGRHRFHWDGRAEDGRPAPAGTYLAVVTSAGREHARKLTVVR